MSTSARVDVYFFVDFFSLINGHLDVSMTRWRFLFFLFIGCVGNVNVKDVKDLRTLESELNPKRFHRHLVAGCVIGLELISQIYHRSPKEKSNKIFFYL